MFIVEFSPSYFTFYSAQNHAHALLPHLKTSHKLSIIALKADLQRLYEISECLLKMATVFSIQIVSDQSSQTCGDI